MAKRPWMMLLVVLGALTSGMPIHAACKMTQYAAVRVDIRENGAVMVPAQVNGKPVWMTLDMAGGMPLAFEKTAEYLGLKKGLAQILATANGRPVEHTVTIPSLVIGAANFAKWDLYLAPESPAEMPMYKGVPYLGTLSSAFMTAVDLELNLAQSELKLFARTRCGNQVVYWGGEVTSARLYVDETGLMVFPMEIEGRRVETAFNTQSASSVISETVTSRFFGFDRNSEGITREVRGNGREEASYRAMGLTAKGLRMNNVRVRLQDDTHYRCVPSTSGRNSGAIGFERCMSRAPFSIGTDLMRKLRIYIASKEGKVYFTRAEAPDSTPAPEAATSP